MSGANDLARLSDVDMGNSRRSFGELREGIWASSRGDGERLGKSRSGYVEPALRSGQNDAGTPSSGRRSVVLTSRSPKTLTGAVIHALTIREVAQTLSHSELAEYCNLTVTDTLAGK